MYSYYEIIRCVKRIALPSPKQHALLNPIFFFLPFFLFFSSLLSSFLPIRFFFCSTTGDTSKRRGFRHNGILLARWSSAHVSFASFRACLNRGNRLSLYLSFLLALSLFLLYSPPSPSFSIVSRSGSHRTSDHATRFPMVERSMHILSCRIYRSFVD